MSTEAAVSIAIPLFNEELVLPELLKRTVAVLDQLPGGFHEIVCVDDGSTDRTLDILKAAAENDPRIVVIRLSRNFGHQAALCAALEHLSGNVAVLMDGDLQDPPEAILRMLEVHQQGYDVVYALRMKRKEGVILRTCYYLFYRLIYFLADVRLPRGAGDFCVMSRQVVDQLNKAPEHHRYLRGLRSWVGFRQIGIPVEREKRLAGTSKYNLGSLFKLAFDGVFSFSVLPLRAAIVIGTASLLLSIIYILYALYAKIVLDQSPQGFTALIVSITFFAGVQLLFLGVIGEYIGRIYQEVKGRPLYVVHDIIKKS